MSGNTGWLLAGGSEAAGLGHVDLDVQRGCGRLVDVTAGLVGALQIPVAHSRSWIAPRVLELRELLCVHS